jgi:hypothetical protein
MIFRSYKSLKLKYINFSMPATGLKCTEFQGKSSVKKTSSTEQIILV